MEDTTQTSGELTSPVLIPDVDFPLHRHHISQIEGNMFRPNCYVCTMYNCEHKNRKSKPRVNMMCLVCKLGFHPTCFTAYHNPNGVSNMQVRQFLRGINPPKENRLLKVKVNNIKVAPLPFEKTN